MKVIIIGSVISSRIVLEKVIDSGLEIQKVFSLDEEFAAQVSGYYPIHELAISANIPYKKFHKINQEDNIREIEQLDPDYIFVVGLSQLIDWRIIRAARRGTIGFHPTTLPKLRGRAAMVWQILLGIKETGCTMFFIDEGTDTGDILEQEPYVIGEEDYASDVEQKLCEALSKMLKRLLKSIEKGNLTSRKQDENEATYLLMRTPADGKIDWKLPIAEIYRLIRAVSNPYPGAFSNYEGTQKVIFWHANCVENKNVIGFPGQIIHSWNDAIDILCVDGILHVDHFTNCDEIIIRDGHRFY